MTTRSDFGPGTKGLLQRGFVPATWTKPGSLSEGRDVQRGVEFHGNFMGIYCNWIYGDFLKWRYPQIIHFSGMFQCKPSILGTPISGNSHIYIYIHMYVYVNVVGNGVLNMFYHLLGLSVLGI